MKNYHFTTILKPAEEGGYTAIVPSLPGCISEGDTLEEALRNIQDAIRGYLESLAKDGQTIPRQILKESEFITQVEVALK